MLAADKNSLVAGLKKQALEIRQRELQFFMERYTNLATQASIVAGFAFDGLVEMEVPEECEMSAILKSSNSSIEGPDAAGAKCSILSFYYMFDAAAMALALYTVCVASFCTVYGQRLALQGPKGSVQRAVAVLVKQRRGLYITFGLSMASLVSAGVMLAWIKMGQAAAAVTVIFLAFFVALAYKYRVILSLFSIPEDQKVTGEVTLSGGGDGGIDLAEVDHHHQAGAGGVPSYSGACLSDGSTSHGGTSHRRTANEADLRSLCSSISSVRAPLGSSKER